MLCKCCKCKCKCIAYYSYWYIFINLSNRRGYIRNFNGEQEWLLTKETSNLYKTLTISKFVFKRVRLPISNPIINNKYFSVSAPIFRRTLDFGSWRHL
jgi:hypothetical protein